MIRSDHPSRTTPLSSILQQFTVTPRDAAASFEKAEAVIRQQVAVTPDANLIDSDTRNRIAIIEASEDSIAQLRASLGEEFLIDPNAPLRF